MRYDFDKVVDRRGTNSLKWDYSKALTGREGLLPLWVADMDFETPEFITEAMIARVERGVFGYSRYPASYFEAVRGWLKQRHDWQISEEWIVPVPGVVPAIGLAMEAYTRPGEKVIIQPPVYYPFRAVIAQSGRQVVENPLKREENRYRLDLEQLEKVIDEDTRALLLCSPHNPVGRVWSAAELKGLTEICLRHDLLLISDEIHCDLVMEGNRHLPAMTLFPDDTNRTVTFTSATKTFNLSGVSCANAIIPDPVTRRRYARQVAKTWLQLPNLMSVVAAEAAYRKGSEWLDQLLAYLGGNYHFLVDYLAQKAPDLEVFPLEGTYLTWIDLSARGLSDDEIKKRLLDQGLWLDDGPMFGTGGKGFQRVNIACPRATLEEALARLVRAAT